VTRASTNQLCLEASTGTDEYAPKPVGNFFGECLAAIPGHKDQVPVHQNAVPSAANVVAVVHTQSYATVVQRLQAFKYELMPTGEQRRDLQRFAGCCRA